MPSPGRSPVRPTSMPTDCAPTSTPSSTRGSMAEPTRGLLDTSVIVDLASLDPWRLPDESAVAAITLAELSAGTHTTDDPLERARRQARLEWVNASFDSIPFDLDAARVYGQAVAAVRASGR